MSRWFHTLNTRRRSAAMNVNRGRTRLNFLSLEDRAVPAVINVTTTADSGPGSLRQALLEANSVSKPGMDTINFDAGVVGTITLSSPLVIDSDITVVGPGANLLAVSGNKAVRVFDVTDSATTSVTAMMSGLTIKDGKATDGAGVRVGQNDVLMLNAMNVTGCVATGSGGGIAMTDGGSLTVTNTTLSANSANIGGGVSFNGTPMGAIVNFRNSTVSGNSAGQGGGMALSNFAGDLMVCNSDVVLNKATAGTGGGIVRLSGTGTVSVVSSIVYGNTTSAATGPDISSTGTVNYRYTILGNKTGITTLADQGNNLAIGTNPFIGALTNNGGPVPTHALLVGSPAIDKGLNPATSSKYDQRGTGYTRSFGTTDIGSFEYATAGIPTVSGTFADVNMAGGTSYTFHLTFTDDVFINVANLATGQDISITGPNGFFAWATYTGVDNPANGTPRVASYSLVPPGGSWDALDNGVYTVTMAKNAVYDSAANAVPAGNIGQFNVIASNGTFIVTNDSDSGPGSLRAAVALANASTGTADTIIFDPTFYATPKTITLTTGEISISDPLNIQGPGASIVTINGNNAGRIFSIDNGKSGAISVNILGVTMTMGQSVTPGGAIVIADEAVSLSGVVLTNNRTTGAAINAGGGAVALTGAGSLSLVDCWITNNKATGAGADGGAIRAGDGSTVSLNATLVTGNSANGDGGALYMSGSSVASSLTILSSTLASNSATDLAGDGGAVFFTGTVSAGGLTIRNSTLSGNTAVAYGGAVGINSLVGMLVVQNSTVTDNSAGSSSKGGGFSQIGGTGSMMFESSIVSANINTNAPDVYTTGKAAFQTSALGSKTGITSYVDNGNNLAIGLALNLGALTNNGGPTPTHLPANSSPVVDRGSNPSGLSSDQRGQARVQGVAADIGAVEITSTGIPTATLEPLVNVTTAGGSIYTLMVTYKDETAINAATIDSNDVRIMGPNGFNVLAKFASIDMPGNGPTRTATYTFVPPGGTWDGIDAGIYTLSMESKQVYDTSANPVVPGVLGTFLVDLPANYIVTNTNDSGAGSLRNAITLANQTTSMDTITFDPAVFNVARTITLTTGVIAISGPVDIVGTGMSQLTISGNNASRIFTINDGSALTHSVVNLSGMTLTAAKSATEGGAVYIFDELVSMNKVAVTANASTTGAGGGIFVASKDAMLSLTDCLVNNNTAGLGMSGGGIRIDGAADVSISRTTISGNVASLRGGGIYFNNGGSLLMVDSTISGNIAQTKDGGGVYFFGVIGASGFTVRNSTVSGNSAGNEGGGFAFLSVTGTPIFQNCTIANNTALTAGGGLSRIGGTNTFNLASCIIAGNSAPTGADMSFNSATVVTANQSLVGIADSGNFSLNGLGNLAGTAGSPLDAKLGALALNGGPTRTHALLANSPAINAGSNPSTLSFDQRGAGYNRVAGKAADIGAFETQTAPIIHSLVINDGGAQRSRITSITVPFDTLVNFAGGNVPAAFKLEKTVSGVPVGTVTIASADLSPSTPMQTMVKLTFNGALTEFGSLVDGRYRLTVFAGTVSNFSGQGLDGNGDGTAGDNYVSGPSAIFRLFGDFDGDGTVGTNDFNSFRTAFGTNTFAFDFDADGDVDTADFAQFRPRFGTSV